ncbi:MAG: hypothetical protein JWN70_4583 [Planctomycetaceae bacterium]|nr:hypothetical protein [Planctomycetaceae bacterium]
MVGVEADFVEAEVAVAGLEAAVADSVGAAACLAGVSDRLRLLVRPCRRRGLRLRDSIDRVRAAVRSAIPAFLPYTRRVLAITALESGLDRKSIRAAGSRATICRPGDALTLAGPLAIQRV